MIVVFLAYMRVATIFCAQEVIQGFNEYPCVSIQDGRSIHIHFPMQELVKFYELMPASRNYDDPALRDEIKNKLSNRSDYLVNTIIKKLDESNMARVRTVHCKQQNDGYSLQFLHWFYRNDRTWEKSSAITLRLLCLSLSKSNNTSRFWFYTQPCLTVTKDITIPVAPLNDIASIVVCDYDQLLFSTFGGDLHYVVGDYSTRCCQGFLKSGKGFTIINHPTLSKVIYFYVTDKSLNVSFYRLDFMEFDKLTYIKRCIATLPLHDFYQLTFPEFNNALIISPDKTINKKMATIHDLQWFNTAQEGVELSLSIGHHRLQKLNEKIMQEIQEKKLLGNDAEIYLSEHPLRQNFIVDFIKWTMYKKWKKSRTAVVSNCNN